MNLEEVLTLQRDMDDMLKTINSYQCLYQTMDKFGYDEAAIVSMGGEALTTSLGILKTEIAGKSDLIKKNIYQANLFTKIKEGFLWLWKKIKEFFRWVCDALYRWITTSKKDLTARKAINLTTIKTFPEDFESPNLMEYQPFYESIKSFGMVLTTLRAYYNDLSTQYNNLDDYYSTHRQGILNGNLDEAAVLAQLNYDYRDVTKFMDTFKREIIAGHYRNGYVPSDEGGAVQPPRVVQEPTNVVEMGWQSGSSFKLVESTLHEIQNTAEGLRKLYKRLEEDFDDCRSNFDSLGIESMRVAYAGLFNCTMFLNKCMTVIYLKGIGVYNNAYTVARDSMIAAYDAYVKAQEEAKKQK